MRRGAIECQLIVTDGLNEIITFAKLCNKCSRFMCILSARNKTTTTTHKIQKWRRYAKALARALTHNYEKENNNNNGSSSEFE